MLFDELHRPVRRRATVVRHIDLQKTASLGAGLSEQDDFTVPAGRSWRGLRARALVSAPPGAASGTHEISVQVVGTFANQIVALASAGFNATLSADHDISSVGLATARVLRLVYTNNTNVAQTNPRNWHITYTEEIS